MTILPWYVAQTKPRQEAVAWENLRRQGYDAYLPSLKVLKRVQHRREVCMEPMFPRYVFFQPGSERQSIAPVRSTLGVCAVVRFGPAPAVLRPGTLDVIRAMEAAQHEVDAKELSRIRPGSKVVVVEGPLAGLEGLVSAISARRVEVLMHLLGTETRVSIAADSLDAVM
ncbi:MAG: transcription termination/antitermination NusG family protein [Rhodocyclaceae bacterium]|nr:transcription termination/antitermination NusG family protein [Rhodocyclaceae bacterium]